MNLACFQKRRKAMIAVLHETACIQTPKLEHCAATIKTCAHTVSHCRSGKKIPWLHVDVELLSTDQKLEGTHGKTERAVLILNKISRLLTRLQMSKYSRNLKKMSTRRAQSHQSYGVFEQSCYPCFILFQENVHALCFPSDSVALPQAKPKQIQHAWVYVFHFVTV